MIGRRAKSNRRRVEESGGVATRRPTYRILAMVLVLLSGCGGYWYGREGPTLDVRALTMWADQFFPIKSVEINDVRKVSRREVLAALNLDGDRGLISADTTKLKQSLEVDLTHTEVWISRFDYGHGADMTRAVTPSNRQGAQISA